MDARIADRYERVARLGAGGMAEVWRARDLRMGRDVAVKLLDQTAAADPAGVERFRREALAVARIAHQNIVAAYDFGVQDGRPYLVMELVAGHTLEALGRVPVARALDVAKQLCGALHAAHQAGVIHRDVKPANILVTEDGTVKVLDFGIARLRDAASALTRTATVVGTSHYMAPEQASGGPTTERTDLYAVGCVLYAMLTGAPPYPGENPMGVLYQHLHAPVPSLRERAPQVSPALDQLVADLLAKDPARRPASAAQVRSRLDQVAGGTAVMAAAPGDSGPEMAPGRAAVPGAAPVGSSTAYLPVAERSTPPRWLVPLGIGVAAVVLLALVVLALLPDEGQRSATPGNSPRPTAAAKPKPSPTPEATDPAAQLDRIRALVDTKVAAGEIDGEAEKKIDEELDKIAEELGKGEPEKAAEKVAELGGKLDEFASQGRISESAHRDLAAALDQLAQLLPATGGGDGDGDGDGGKGKGGKDDD